jgi:multidrug efflux pump
VLVFSGGVFLFREPLLEVFGSNQQLLTVGVIAVTAQLIGTVFNGFTGLVTTLFQATGKAPAAMIMSMAQGVLFIPIVILGNLWFGLAGIIWAMTATELLVLAAGGVLYLVYRRSIAAAADQGSEEQAEAALEAMAG